MAQDRRASVAQQGPAQTGHSDAEPDDRAMPPGAARAFLGIAGAAFVLLIAFVIAYGVYGETLTAGVDTACARAAFAAGKRMEKLGNYDQAIALFRRALEGRFQDKQEEYMCGRSIGELYFRMGRFADAIDTYRQLPPEALSSAGSLTGYVSALYRKGDYVEAERLGAVWLEKAAAEQDVQQQVWANHLLGLICLETQRPERAVPYFEAVARVSPANSVNLDIARLLQQQGLNEQALAQIDAVLAHTPPGALHNEAAELRGQIQAAQ